MQQHLRRALRAFVLPTLIAASLPAQTTSTDRVRAEFGAANFVPADVAWFHSDLRLGEQWQLLQGSRAWRELSRLPMVTAGLSLLYASPAWRQYQKLRDDSPQFDAAMELLGDAVSQEVFVCADARFVPFAQRFAAAYVETALAVATAMRGEPGQRLPLVQYMVGCEVPTGLIGCRLRDPVRAKELLQFAVARLQEMQGPPIDHVQRGGGSFDVLRLDAKMLPPFVREEMREGLAREGADEDLRAGFDRWVDGLTLAIAVGLRGDYLLLSIGPDTRLLERLGGDGCLADAPALAPARAVAGTDTTALGYTCPELSARQPMARELGDVVADLCERLGERVPEGLGERLRSDLHALLDERAAGFAEPRAEVSMARENHGVESWSFVAAPAGAADDTKPLSTLGHGGKAPLLLAASRAPALLPDYTRFVHWLQVGFGYFTDFVVPTLGGRDRHDYERFRDGVLPFFAEMDDVLREDLLPSLDRCESLCVLDAAGELPAVPGLPLERPLRLPRPAIVQQLRDGERFDRAMRRAYRALGELLGRMGGREVELPQLAGARVDDGLRYAWALSAVGLTPTALVGRERVVAALDEATAHALMADAPPLRVDVVDLDRPAFAVLHVDLAALCTMLVDDAETLLGALHAANQIDERAMDQVRAHVPGLRRALGALRSYSSRTWIENGLEVTHSWLRVEDAPR